jgi:hypothetical protein
MPERCSRVEGADTLMDALPAQGAGDLDHSALATLLRAAVRACNERLPGKVTDMECMSLVSGG